MDWVCDDAWRGAFTQSLFYVGGVVGTLFSATPRTAWGGSGRCWPQTRCWARQGWRPRSAPPSLPSQPSDSPWGYRTSHSSQSSYFSVRKTFKNHLFASLICHFRFFIYFRTSCRLWSKTISFPSNYSHSSSSF